MYFMPGLSMDLPDLLSRCMNAPAEAWKKCDLIDPADFEYNPLLSLIPDYLAAMNIHYGDHMQGRCAGRVRPCLDS